MMEEQNNPSQPEDADTEPQGDVLHTDEQVDEKGLREKSLGAKYQAEIKGDVTSQNIGDNHQHFNIDNRQSFNIVVESEGQARSLLSGVIRTSSSDEMSDFSANSFKVGTRKAKLESEHVQGERPAQEAQDKPLPQTEEEIAHWYLLLTEHEQSLVQAMAIFAGASLPEIAYARNRLYTSLAEIAKRQSSAPSSDEQSPSEAQKQARLLPSTLKHLYMEPRRLDREEGLYWRDTEANGFSPFQLRLLNFLARSAPLWTESIFLVQLRAWAESLDMDSENAFRATRALGVVYWHYIGSLRAIANSWTVKQSNRWSRAAWLLYGAYEADLQEFGAKANNSNASPVLQLLGQWVRKARQAGAVNKGCAAALTYTLIGLHSLKTAIHGLGSLLELPRIKKGNGRKQGADGSEETEIEITEAVYECVVLGLHELAMSGYLAEILQYLAHQVQSVSYHRLPFIDMTYRERAYYRVQRQLTLVFALDTFFRIAGTSFRNVKARQDWVNYNPEKPLPSPLSPLNRDGREVLLASIVLTGGSPLYEPLRSLLCAVLIENVGDLREVGLALLREWTDFVLKDQSPQPGRVRQAYIQFLVELDRETRKWGQHIDDLGFHVSPATDRFQQRLRQWQQEGRRHQQPLEMFAQEVLALLSA